MTRSLKQLMLRGLVIPVALGFAAVGGAGTAAYAAAGSGGSTAATSSHGRSGTAPGQTSTAGTNNNSPQSSPSAGPAGSGSANGARGRSTTPPSNAGTPASGNSANGNKGHIQIEGTPDCGTTLCGDDNDPHVAGCTLTVELFGYPSGTNTADLTIRGQAPSGTATVLTDGPFTFSGSQSPNGNILDTSRTYTLTSSQLAGLTPQAQQGYHLRVEVAVNGFHAKTHVLWLDCVPVSGTSGGPPTVPGSGGTPTVSGSTGAQTGQRGLIGRTGDSPAVHPADASDTPLSVMAGRDSAGTPDSSGLAFTGFDLAVALSVALALLLCGVGFVVLSRRANRVHV